MDRERGQLSAPSVAPSVPLVTLKNASVELVNNKGDLMRPFVVGGETSLDPG